MRQNKKKKAKTAKAGTTHPSGEVLVVSDDRFCVWGECVGKRNHRTRGLVLKLAMDPKCVELVSAVRAQAPSFTGWKWGSSHWIRCSCFKVFRWDETVLGVLLEGEAQGHSG